jgi:hypothetical protein
MSLEMKYFILKPKSKYKKDIFALASREAMRTYAAIVESEDKNLSNSLHAWAIKESIIDKSL